MSHAIASEITRLRRAITKYFGARRSASWSRSQPDFLASALVLMLSFTLLYLLAVIATPSESSERCHGCGKPITMTEAVKEGTVYRLTQAFVLVDTSTNEELYIGYPFDTFPRDKRFHVKDGKVVVHD